METNQSTEVTKVESLPIANFSPEKDEVEILTNKQGIPLDKRSHQIKTLGEVAAEMEKAEKELYHNL
jgi:hypothetical protein